MIAKTNSASVLGIDAHPVDVEVDVSIGLSTFNIVGLPDGTIKESRDRVTAAVTNSGFNFPVRRIVVNLAPAASQKNLDRDSTFLSPWPCWERFVIFLSKSWKK